MGNEVLQPDWQNIDLSGHPHLVVGRKKGKGFDVARVELHEDLFEEIRVVSGAAIERLASADPRRYEPYAEVESEDEYFLLNTQDIARARQNLTASSDVRDVGHRDSTGDMADLEKVTSLRVDLPEKLSVDPVGSVDRAPQTQEPSALLEKLRNPGSLPILNREQLLDYPSLFYAIAWQQRDESWSVFVRKQNPRVAFKPGRRWCRYADSLKEVSEEPVFVVDDSIDLVIYEDNISGFSSKVIKELFTDVGIFKADVPQHVQKASALIGAEIPLTEQSAASLNSLGKRKTDIASRLYGLAHRIEELRSGGVLTSDRYREVAQDDSRALSLLNDQDEFDFDEEHAGVFLDIIEGRYFEDDWTGSPRRADKFSSRL